MAQPGASEGQAALLRGYYPRFLGRRGTLIPIQVFGYGERIRPLLEILAARTRPGRILDAGSGYGTESLLFALLGHDVTGVELVAERAEIARTRIAFFASKSPVPLRLEFVNANILGHLRKGGRADVIWAMESISHIYPPRDFFNLAFDYLVPGGILAVSDPNPRHPLAWGRAARIRGSLTHRPHRKFSDPDTGLPVDYGQENLFSAGRLKTCLRAAGFTVQSIQFSGFMGASLWPEALLRPGFSSALLRAVHDSVRAVPGLNSFGTLYTLIAVKP